MTLGTAEDVIRRSGVTHLPEYEDVAPMGDSAGFYAYRPYPPGSELSSIVTKDGRAAVRCYVRFVVAPLAARGVVARVELEAWLSRRWHRDRPLGYEPAAGDSPDGPSPNSRPIWERARKPVDLDADDVGEFFYDVNEDVFRDLDGNIVTPAQLLEHAYIQHCRTLRLGFRIRWHVGSFLRWAVRGAVWGTQDLAMWALLTFYDIELTENPKQQRQAATWRHFFHKYTPADFRRTTDPSNGKLQFFGFTSSRRSFFTNLLVVVAVCGLAYWRWRDHPLIEWLYSNTALTTTALLFVFLLTDTVGPWVLIQGICKLSILRDRVLFFTRKAKP